MADMYDAVNPANLPAFLNGAPALRITVLADPDGQAFDSETGNAGVDAVASGINVRHDRGEWSIGYTDEANFEPLTTALAARGLEWSEAAAWPAVGVYLWCAAPGVPNGGRPAWATVQPLCVQNRDAGLFDVSYVLANFPARVAGYLDGAVSAWPAAAWARYATITATAPKPPDPPPPAPVTGKDIPLLLIRNPTTNDISTFDGTRRHHLGSLASVEAIKAAGVAQVDLDPADFDNIPVV